MDMIIVREWPSDYESLRVLLCQHYICRSAFEKFDSESV